MSEQTPTVSQRLLGVLIITGFVAFCGFLIGFPRGYFVEGGTFQAGLAYAAKTSAVYLAFGGAVLLIRAILIKLKTPQPWINAALIMLMLGGISACQTIVDGEPELFWKELSSGAGLGALIAIGVYFAGRRGWIPYDQRRPRRKSSSEQSE